MAALGWEHLLKWPMVWSYFKPVISHLVSRQRWAPWALPELHNRLAVQGALSDEPLFLPRMQRTSSTRKGDSVQMECEWFVQTWHWKPVSVDPETEAKLERKQFVFINCPVPPCLVASDFINPSNVLGSPTLQLSFTPYISLPQCLGLHFVNTIFKIHIDMWVNELMT